MLRNHLVEALQKALVKVTFKKKDGSIRVMECTLISDFLPDIGHASSISTSDEVIPVWDLEADAWRSFRVDSLIDVEIIE